MIIKTLISNPSFPFSYISDFPDHATFREKGGNNGESDKLDVFLSLVSTSKLSSIMVYKKNNVDPVVTLCWCVCLTVSMVATCKTAGLEKTVSPTLIHLPFSCLPFYLHTPCYYTFPFIAHIFLLHITFYYTLPFVAQPSITPILP